MAAPGDGASIGLIELQGSRGEKAFNPLLRQGNQRNQRNQRIQGNGPMNKARHVLHAWSEKYRSAVLLDKLMEGQAKPG